MPIGTAVHERTFRALREPELSRVVWLLRCQLLRSASRARVQRDPQRRRVDRHLAALQVPGDGAGRDAVRRPRDHPRHAQGRGRAGHLHAVVRRAREGDRRRDGSRLAENTYRWTAADPSLRWFTQNAAGMEVEIEDISESTVGARAAGPDLGASAQEHCRGRGHREPEILPRHGGRRSRACASKSRAPATRATSVMRFGFLRKMPSGSGTRSSARGARSTSSRRDARARRCARRGGAAPDRRGFSRQQEGADRRAEVLAVRAGPRSARQSRQGASSSGSRRLRKRSGAATRARSWGLRSIGRASSVCTKRRGCRLRFRPSRRASRCPCIATARRWARLRRPHGRRR